MKKAEFISLLLIICFGLTGCATSSKNQNPVPQWLSNIESVYSKSEYIAQIGYGVTEPDAKANAMAELASYFNVTIKNTIEAESQTIKDAASSVTYKNIKTSTITTTDLDLFGMETTEGYYLKEKNKSNSKWYCAAYINRQDAWNQYESQVQKELKAFYSVYNLAFETEDPLNRIKTLSKAEEVSDSFVTSYYAATMLSKELTEKKYKKDLDTVASIQGLIQKEKNNCSIIININEDYQNTVKSCIEKSFKDLGFTVTNKNQNAYYKLDAELNFNRYDEEDLIVLYPEITITVHSDTDFSYVYNGKADKILSYNITKAKKNSCEAISTIVTNELSSDFSNATGLLKD